jgi:hypothetical protein
MSPAGAFFVKSIWNTAERSITSDFRTKSPGSSCRQMKLTTHQEADVQRIMAGIDCPAGFPCYKSEFENVSPVRLVQGSNVIQCEAGSEQKCPMSYEFSHDIRFCQCRLRRYVALELGR